MDSGQMKVITEGFVSIIELLKETNTILENGFQEMNKKLEDISSNTFSMSLP